MSNNEKDQTYEDLCKSHGARCDKDYYRICPSKLSKRELEDLYYSLLQTNMDLKRSVNSQNEKIRQLSTKLHRVTVQNKTRDPKQCCMGAKAVIAEQKNTIADLQRANENMAERIRRLNMRLCTAKQFLKQSPYQTTNRCFKCFSNASTSVKNVSTSDFHNKNSDVNLKTNELSTQTSPVDNKTVETNTYGTGRDIEKVDAERVCEGNKCRSTMEELTQKIVDLQEELSTTQTENSTRISQLEQQVSDLRAASVRARQELAPCLHNESESRAQRDKTDLQMQLLIEKQRVAELETRLKAANMSREVAKTIEEHQTASKQLEARQRASVVNEQCYMCVSPYGDSSDVSPKPTVTKRPSYLTVPDDRPGKSDDSGYADSAPDSGRKDGSISSVNRELAKRIAYLQAQLDTLKSISGSSNESKKCTPNSKSDNLEACGVVIDKPDVAVLNNDKDHNCIVIGPTDKAIVEITHMNKGTTELEVELFNTDKNNVSTPNGTRDNQEIHVKNKDNLHEPLKSTLKPKTVSKIPRRLTVELKQTSNDDKKLPETLLIDNISEKQRALSIQAEIKNNLASQNVTQNIEISDNVYIETSKPVEDNESSLSKKDNVSMLQEPSKDENLLTRQMAQTNTLSGTVHVICECSKCEDLSNTYLHVTKRVGHQIYENQMSQSISGSVPPKLTQEESHTPSKTDQKPLKERSDTHNSMQIPGPLPVNKTFSTVSKTGRPSKTVPLKGKKVKNGKNRAMSLDSEQITVVKQDVVTTNNTDDKGGLRMVCNTGSYDKEAVHNVRNRESNPVSDFEQPGTIKGSKVEDLKDLIESKPKSDVQTKKDITFDEHIENINDGNITRLNKAGGTGNVKEETDMKQNDLPKPMSSKPTELDRPSTPSSGKTYRVPTPEPRVCSRATSPENTDNEISYLTDLPTERDGTTPRDALSPGEHTLTTTYRESYSPYYDRTLSEGEVPTERKYFKRNSLSVGEQPGDPASTNRNPPESSAQKMEAALQAISLELARCRTLLESQRAREIRPSKDASATADLPREEPIALRKVEGRQSINGTWTPMCIFTLHIGTAVLSDEAVINCRDTPLMLTWKFYDQNVAMTRMKMGRVVHFDFSTEYEIKITDNLIDYLKHDEMLISICEIDHNEKAFATCALPLREALLNANRRADLSLAMVAGPHLPRAQDALDSSDEVGVLDLWCMLRAEPKNLAVINQHIDAGLISGTDTPNTKGDSLVQMIEDDVSAEFRFSQDLDLDMYSQYGSRQKTEEVKPSTIVEQNKVLNTVTKSSHVPETQIPLKTIAEEDKLSQTMTETAKSLNIGPFSNVPRTPLNVQNSLVPQHNKLRTASITSDLDMKSNDTASLLSGRWRTSNNKPGGIMLSEVKPRLRRPSDLKDIWDKQAGSSFPSLNKNTNNIRASQEDRLSNVTNIAEYWASKCSQKNKPWIPNKPPPPGNQAAQQIQQKLDEFMTMKRKRIDSMQSLDTGKRVTISSKNDFIDSKLRGVTEDSIDHTENQTLDITVLWLALNEECEAMLNPNVRRLYVAYSFLGRDGAELETPVSLPKPRHYIDKCYFNFTKSFHISEFDMPILEHMAKCRSHSSNTHSSKDCIVFSVVSEPPEENFGSNCEDIGYAFLYLGDLLAYCSGDSFAEVLPVRTVQGGGGVCGVLAVRVDGLDVVRACVERS